MRGCAHRDAGRVLVVVDFDADGATGSAQRVRALCALKCADFACATMRGMEVNQVKRFIKDLEERTDSLRRYL
jgi:single-stranded DNA-specific DHH superfamily exonuclease